MSQILQKIPFLIELFFNGTFILIYSLKSLDKIPLNWNMDFVNIGLEKAAMAVPVVLFLTVISNFLGSKGVEDFLRKYIFSAVVFIPMVLTWGDMEFTFGLASAHLLSSVLALYDEDKELRFTGFQKRPELFKGIRLRPAQMVLLSFAAVILLGTFLLMLPPVTAGAGQTISFIDALFMATSATCVTGLSTISLATDFSLFGQVVILILIQIGGLSIMTLYSSMAILLGRNMRMKDRIVMQDLLDVSSLEELFVMIVNIIKYTFFIELWGGIVLTIAFTFEGFEFSQAIYYGFFHSISAFCNAGFALFDTSLESYATSPLIHGTISILVTLGGLGFIVLKELKEVVSRGKSLVRLTVHSKMVLVTSAALTVTAALFIFFGEFLNALDSYSLWEKMQISFFQSVTLRTAGFNTIPLTNLNTYTIYIMTLFMFIGGSPGSTAGGIKTSTLAILIQSIMATLKGEKKVTAFDRNLSTPVVVRATALTFISILITSFFIFILMQIEPDQSFLPIFFEVMSASGTVGLTLGITSSLSFWGKAAVASLMLIGRIGPLTLVLAIGQRNKSKGKIEYPDGRIMIG